MGASLKVRHYSKHLALILIGVGIPTMVLDTSPGAQIPLLVGLFTLLVTANKIEDERSVQLKTTSLYIAFIIAYGVKLLTTNLHDHQLIPFEFVEIDHFLILLLILANSIFYGRLYFSRY